MTLQWRHISSTTSQITGNSRLFVQQLVQAYNKRNIKCGSAILTLWQGNPPHKGPMTSRRVTDTKAYHYNDVIMTTIASQITSLTIVYSTVYSDADQSKHQSSASLAFVWGIHRGPGNSPHKWPVTRKMFPFDDVIMWWCHYFSPKNATYRYFCWLYLTMKSLS